MSIVSYYFKELIYNSCKAPENRKSIYIVDYKGIIHDLAMLGLLIIFEYEIAINQMKQKT